MPISYRNPTPSNLPLPVPYVPDQLAARLGSGLAAPMQLLANNTWQTTAGLDNVQQSMLVALVTSPGSRFGQCDYGSLLWRYVFEPWTSVSQQGLTAQIQTVLNTWEPNITVTSCVFDTTEITNEQLGITVNYSVKGTNSKNALQFTLQSPNTVILPPQFFTIGNRQVFRI
jgi:phage baseplate assembly protein W